MFNTVRNAKKRKSGGCTDLGEMSCGVSGVVCGENDLGRETSTASSRGTLGMGGLGGRARREG